MRLIGQLVMRHTSTDATFCESCGQACDANCRAAAEYRRGRDRAVASARFVG